MLGLTLALYTHAAFFVYAVIYLTIEAIYFRDRPRVRAACRRDRALGRRRAADALGIAALPGLRQLQQHGLQPGRPYRLGRFARSVYYNVEILALPHRWFNDYRSVNNVWLPVLAVSAVLPGRSRTSFYAWMAVVTQLLLRVNTPEAGAMFDRIQHMFPLLTAPALAGFVLRCGGTRTLATALLVPLALMCRRPSRRSGTSRICAHSIRGSSNGSPSSDGNMILVEVSPHRDMDSHPTRRTPTTPFDVHFEGLLPVSPASAFTAR